ncbi:hypothetical protein [Collimonas arenae]|nr:hypothetical protein [Collimonas arenae]
MLDRTAARSIVVAQCRDEPARLTNLQCDGIASSVAESHPLDALSRNNMAIYDRVEFVRGATGLMQEAGKLRLWMATMVLSRKILELADRKCAVL